MSSCDLCGRESELFISRIESSVVNACESCSRFGKIIGKAEEFRSEIKTKRSIEDENEEIIVKNYNEIIRKEREKRNLKQDELANKLNEKEISYSSCGYLELSKLEPQYKTFKGWDEEIVGVKKFSNLPKEAKEYIKFIEKFLGVKIAIISTGPAREEYIKI